MATGGAGTAGSSCEDSQLRNEEDIVEQLEKLRIVGTEKFDVDQLIDAVNKIVAERDELRKQLRQLNTGGSNLLNTTITMLEEEVSMLKNVVDVHARCYKQAISLLGSESAGMTTVELQMRNVILFREVIQKSDTITNITNEKIKNDALLNTVRKHKDALKKQVDLLESQLRVTNLVVLDLKENEQTLQNSLATVKHEAELLRGLAEQKGVGAPSAADVNVLIQQQIREQVQVDPDSEQDVMLLQEIQDLLQSVTCTSCQIKPKNAILTKCCHMFCYDCLHARYKKKQRTCPKCELAFGGKDYDRINLAM